MKVFVFTIEKEIPSKKNDFHNRRARIYEIKQNIPEEIGTVSYTWGRSQGDESEVFKYLINRGLIPKELYDVSKSEWRGAGYYCPEIERMGYKIIGLGQR